jgi:signal transduction histidine kinase
MNKLLIPNGIKQLSLRNKLILGFALPIALLVLVAYIGFITSNGIRSAFISASEVSLPIVTALEEMKFAGSRLISSTNEFILDKNLGGNETPAETEATPEQAAEDRELAEIKATVALYNTSFERYRRLVIAANDASQLAVVETSGQKLLDSSNEVVALQTSGTPLAEVLEIREELEDSEREFLAAITTALEYEKAKLTERQQSINTASTQSAIVVVSIALISLIVTSGVGLYIFWSITRPLSQLKAAAASFSGGDLEARANVNTSDEVGQVAKTFDQMADRFKTLVTELNQRIEESQAARDRAERSDQVKSAFLASMSHELRTPLNAIINFTKFVAKGSMGPVNAEQVETLNEVIDSAKHLLNLINDVLDMSKIESGSLNLFIEKNVDLRAILNTVIATGKSLLGDKSVKVETDIEADLPSIQGDRQRILQILLNVMSNACKFTEDGYIKLGAYRQQDEVIFAIADTGPGIAAEDQTAVFEAFKQTSTGLRQGGGTGLGMPIAKSLAEAHGGRLWLESEPGKGSTFYIALPIQSVNAAPALVA